MILSSYLSLWFGVDDRERVPGMYVIFRRPGSENQRSKRPFSVCVSGVFLNVEFIWDWIGYYKAS